MVEGEIEADVQMVLLISPPPKLQPKKKKNTILEGDVSGGPGSPKMAPAMAQICPVPEQLSPCLGLVQSFAGDLPQSVSVKSSHSKPEKPF